MSEINLFPHQKEALEKTKDNNRVAYYLDMGLGKTFVGSEKVKQLDADINLVICQKSKIEDWYNHFVEFYPEQNVIKYSKSRSIPDKATIIINYDLVWRRPELAKLKNFTLMLDESSYIKNPSSKRTKFITKKLKPDNVILLSGTPCSGKYEELITQIHMLGWKITKTTYWNTYINYFNMNINGFKIPKVTGYKNVDRLKRKLRDYGAVFMKTEEVFDLPEQNFILETVKNTRDYNTFKKDRLLIKDDLELVGDTTLTYRLYLRQLASQYNKNKIERLKEVLEGTEDRVIIFYNFNEELKQLKEVCDKLKRPISVVNGTKRDTDAYTNINNSVTLVQYQAGAMGLNLQKSNKIIYYSLPLSSDLFEQSKKRIHRIGQNKSCFYWILQSKNTIDENIYKTLLLRKDYTDELFKTEFK